MSTKKTCEGPLFGSVQRGDTPLDCGFGAEYIDIEPAAGEPIRVCIEDAPSDTIAKSPDDAARSAEAIQSISSGKGCDHLGFRVEYLAD